MKKLLLLILPMLLLFGVSFADTWTFQPYTPNTTYAVQNVKLWSIYFALEWNSWNKLTLHQIRQYDWNTCPSWRVYKYSEAISNYVQIASGDYSIPITGSLQTIDVELDIPWQYVVANYSPTWCYAQTNTNRTMYASWFFTFYWWERNYNNYNLKQYLMTPCWPYQLVFSWTDPFTPAPATPITIHYNWTTTWYAGTDIYLQWQFNNPFSSWGFLYFIANTFRALFRWY